MILFMFLFLLKRYKSNFCEAKCSICWTKIYIYIQRLIFQFKSAYLRSACLQQMLMQNDSQKSSRSSSKDATSQASRSSEQYLGLFFLLSKQVIGQCLYKAPLRFYFIHSSIQLQKTKSQRKVSCSLLDDSSCLIPFGETLANPFT